METTESHDVVKILGLEKLWAQGHVLKSGDKLRVTSENSIYYPRDLVTSIDGNPQPSFITNDIATQANKRFPEMMASIKRQGAIVKSIHDEIEAGYNVALLTGHSDLIDVALAEAAVYGPLRDMDTDMESAIFINHMIRYLDYQFISKDSETEEETIGYMPATEALGFIANKIFTTHPATDSARQALEGISEAAIRGHNTDVGMDFKDWSSAGSKLFAVAGSGTVDKNHTMASLSPGTLSLLSAENTKVVTVAINYETNITVCEFVHGPEILTRDGVEDGMRQMASVLTDRLGFPYRYAA